MKDLVLLDPVLAPVSSPELAKDLHCLERHWGIAKLLAKTTDTQQIISYYRWNQALYRYFHSPEGAMHLPIREEGVNHQEGLAVHSQLLSQFWQELPPGPILEIGCGMGYNLRRLASQFPQRKFYGIDLVASNIKRARQVCQEYANVHFVHGNFMEPEVLSASWAGIFAVESFCYFEEVGNVLDTICQSLRPDGKFVLFDALLNETFPGTDVNSQIAARLCARGYALEQWPGEQTIKSSALALGLHLVEEQDFSAQVLPNLIRFQEGCRRMLQKSRFLPAWLLTKYMLPSVIRGHLFAGLLGPYPVQAGLLRYKMLAFQNVGI